MDKITSSINNDPIPNPHYKAKVLFYFILAILSFVIIIAFANVFFTGEGYYNGIRTGKIFYLLEYSIFVIPIAGVLLLRNFRQSLDWLSIVLIFFTGWIFLIGREGGIWQDEKAWYFFTGVVFFILVKSFLSAIDHLSTSFIRWVLIGLVLAIALIGGSQAILGELQVLNLYPIFHNTYKITGTFFNPGPYAGFLIASLPFSLCLVCLPRTLKWQSVFHWIGLLSCTVILAVLPATQSRAGWIGLFAAGGYFMFHQFSIGNKIKKFYQRNKGIALMLTFALFLMVSSGLYNMYLFKQDSADGRMLIWKVATNILKQNPWTGTGFDTFQAHYAPALAGYFRSGEGSETEEMLAGNVQWAFNEPLQFGVELGIPGAVLYMLLVLTALFLPVKEIWKEQSLKTILLAARSSLIAIFTFGLFSYPFYSAPITLLFFFSLGIIAASLRGIRIRSLSFTGHGAMLVFLIVTGYQTYGNVSERKYAYWIWDEAGSLYQIKFYEAANNSFKEALPVLQNNGMFMQQYGKCLQMSGQYEHAKEVLKQSGKYYIDDFWYLTLGEVNKELGNFSEAEMYYNVAAVMVPHKLYPKYLLAKLYDTNGQRQKAKIIAKDILNSDVKIMSTAVKEIWQEMNAILHDQKED